jgi:hypothetical protein
MLCRPRNDILAGMASHGQHPPSMVVMLASVRDFIIGCDKAEARVAALMGADF